MTPKLRLSEPQRLFAKSRYQYPAFVGGVGSGKTFAGVLRLLSLKSQCVGQDVAYYMPTHDLVAQVAFPRVEHLLDTFQVRAKFYRSPPYWVDTPGWDGRIIFRTMDSPEKIIGYEVAHSIVDELDTLPDDKAEDVWNKVIARNRVRSVLPASVGVTTTPEGFRFVYRRWKKDVRPGYKLYRARTADNAHNLDPGYVDNLVNTYTGALQQAYLDGEFVPMRTGRVYGDFDRALNASRETIHRVQREPLHIGMDFNVSHGAAVVFVLRNSEPHAVEELTEVFDTPAMVALIKQRYPGHQIMVYPDPTGKARDSSGASQTDLALLRQAGFHVLAFSGSPAVKDRVLAMNVMITKRRLRVNVDGCPAFVEALEKQAYTKNGEPDKSSGLDHVVDAAGYFVLYRYPIASVIPMQKVRLGGV